MLKISRGTMRFNMAAVGALLLLTYLTTATIKAEVVIENNGYSGLIIAIHKSVRESPMLLQAIKNMIQRASPLLYKSIKQRAYFRQATVVVPASWTTQPEYTPVPNQDYMGSAEVRIAPPHPSHGDTPYTLQLGECGERGQYIHLTPEFLLQTNAENKTKDKRNSKIFLHEWAHLRYGVFNEYGEKGSPNSPLFYMDKHEKVRPTACSKNITGRIRRGDGISPCIIDINNNLVSDCTFFPDLKTGMTSDGSGRASPMYMPELDSADEFCGGDSETVKHDPSAPNMHNRMCLSRSVLDVILSNPDFKDDRNPQREIKKLKTEINVVQIKKRMSPKFVLVLDVSGSMKGDPMSNLQFATSRFIKFHIKEACNITLGMVSFASESTVLANLTLVGNITRERLITQIPKDAVGGTAIGKGILKALEMLNPNGNSTEKSRIILLTDGEENATPYVNSTYDNITEAGVVIYTLAIGKKASKSLEEISKRTDGRADFYDPTDTGKSLDSILNAMIIASGCGDLQPIITTNRAILLESGKDMEGVFDIDNDVRSTIVFMSYNYPRTNAYSGSLPVATVFDPSGNKYTQDSPECTWDKNLHSILFKIPQAQVGKWKYRLENPGDEHVHVHLMITSDTNDEDQDKNIRVKSWVSDVNIKYPQVSKIFAEVKKDYMPVVRATVVAIGHRPDGSEEKILLKDNGKGADIYADDGVYTEYFTRYNGSGRYAIDVNVENTPYTKLNTFKDYSRARAPKLPILEFDDGEKAHSDFSLTELEKVNEVFEASAIYNADKKDSPDYDSMASVHDFQRFGTAGTFFLHDWKAKDLIPPSRITDLHATRTDFIARTVQLEWTSPGDDMYDGQATSIEVRYHIDSVFLTKFFLDSFSQYTLAKGTLIPPTAYTPHSVVIQLPPEDDFSIMNSSRIVYFAVRASDDQQNIAPVSNVAIAHFPTKEKLEFQTGVYWYYLVAITLFSVLLAIAVFFAFLTYLRRQPAKSVRKAKYTRTGENLSEEMAHMANPKTNV